MPVPSYLIEEALRRLSDAPVRDFVRKAGLDPDLVPGPEPDLEAVREAYAIQGVPTDAGSIVVEGSLSLLGATMPVHLRVTFAGEFGLSPDEFEGFGQIGVVQRMEVLIWPSGTPAPKWREIDIGLLSPAMFEALDALVLKQVTEFRGQTFL